MRQRQSIKISTDLYRRKCPFSKCFKNLIKDCCANSKHRISINKLIEHKFFAKIKGKYPIKQYDFGHILKSTEKRINHSLSAPMSLKHANHRKNIQNVGNSRNKKESKKDIVRQQKNGNIKMNEVNGGNRVNMNDKVDGPGDENLNECAVLNP